MAGNLPKTVKDKTVELVLNGKFTGKQIQQFNKPKKTRTTTPAAPVEVGESVLDPTQWSVPQLKASEFTSSTPGIAMVRPAEARTGSAKLLLCFWRRRLAM